MTVAGLTSIGVGNTGLFTQNSGNALPSPADFRSAPAAVPAHTP